MPASTTTTTPLTSQSLDLFDRHLAVPVGDEVLRFHYVWLRDNCWCSECKVAQTKERKLFTPDIPAEIAPMSASLDSDGTLHIYWSDKHLSLYSANWLRIHDYSERARAGRRHEPTLWDASLDPIPAFEHEAVVGTGEGQLDYLDAIRDYGVAIVHNTPTVPGHVERFAEAIGHVRETAFERIHNVQHDPTGYSVAHTPMELKPHTDLPSYHWPPSIQLLHFLVNEATGGESTLTDGWAVLADLRAEDPHAFETLCRVPIPFQVFSEDEDTFATAPMIQLDSEGQVRTFRFSNQLAQPLDTSFEDVEAFYAAYRKLGMMIASTRYTTSFKTATGDLVTVHGHRVLHGRLSFDPTSGARHLQDVYMEYDDLMALSALMVHQSDAVAAPQGDDEPREDVDGRSHRGCDGAGEVSEQHADHHQHRHGHGERDTTHASQRQTVRRPDEVPLLAPAEQDPVQRGRGHQQRTRSGGAEQGDEVLDLLEGSHAAEASSKRHRQEEREQHLHARLHDPKLAHQLHEIAVEALQLRLPPLAPTPLVVVAPDVHHVVSVRLRRPQQ